MLAQLEVKEINSRTFKDFYWIFKDFPVLEYIFFQFKDFPGFSRPVYTLYIYINANMADKYKRRNQNIQTGDRLRCVLIRWIS